jgi:hypothetical protein
MRLASQIQGAASAADRGELLRAYAREWSVDERTARRHAGVRVRPPVPKEAPAPDPILDQVVSLWLASATEKFKEPTTPLWRVVEEAENARLIAPGTLSVGQLRRYLDRHHLSLREQRRGAPHIHQRSEHPNHVHLADVSWCRQYHLRRDGRIDVQSYARGTAEYRNKDLPRGSHLLRFVLVDHASGALYVQYHTDETAPTLLTFLAGAWFPKRQRREVGPTGVERWWPAPFEPEAWDTWSALPLHRDYPFRGVPRILVLDRGAANQAEVTQRLCERLGVQLIIAQRARAKGPVESMMWKWERAFEGSLAVQPAPDLRTLNIWALDFLARWSLTRTHRRHGMTRMQAWTQIEREQLRELTGGWPVFRELATRAPEPRTVKSGDVGGYVSHEGRDWRVPDPALIYQRVHVWYSAFDPDTLWARTAEGRVIQLERIRKDRFGYPEHAATIGEEYRAHPDTPTQQTQKRLAAVRAAMAAPEIFGREGEKTDVPALLGPRQGVEIALTTTAGTREISRLEFSRRARARLQRPLTDDEGQLRDGERYFAGRPTLPEAKLDEFLADCAQLGAGPALRLINIRR